MIKARRTYGQGLEITIEAESQAEIFKKLASYDEVFSDMECIAEINGVIHTSTECRFNVRKNSAGHEYLEILCVENGPLNGYKKKISQHNDNTGNLYPKREAGPNEIGGIRGWFKYINPEG